MKIFLGKKPTAEEMEDAANLLAFAQKEFREWVKPHFLPKIETAGKHWKVTEATASFFLQDALGLRVMLSGNTEADGRKWLHLSCSRKTRLPSWVDMKTAKNLFLGEEAKAMQIFPPASEYVNYSPNVLHLWQCLTEDVLPDFRIKLPGGGFII